MADLTHATDARATPLHADTVARLAAILTAIVGARHVLRRPSALRVYDSDGLPGYHRQPALGVLPGTREELIAVVRALAAEGAPFVARGAGTGLSGGSLADGIVVVGLNRMNRVLSIDAENALAVVEPGVVRLLPQPLHGAPAPGALSRTVAAPPEREREAAAQRAQPADD
ncbi:MAG: FAD-binding oxidoreductase, partial [Gemmatirosa sp.]